MKEKMIRVLTVEPGKLPKVVELKNELTALQEIVSEGADYRGLIEIVSLDNKTCLLLNEEGKLIGLKPNRRLGQDILCGVFYVTGQNNKGELYSLDEKRLAEYAGRFIIPETFTDGEVAETIITRFFCCEG